MKLKFTRPFDLFLNLVKVDFVISKKGLFTLSFFSLLTKDFLFFRFLVIHHWKTRSFTISIIMFFKKLYNLWCFIFKFLIYVIFQNVILNISYCLLYILSNVNIFSVICSIHYSTSFIIISFKISNFTFQVNTETIDSWKLILNLGFNVNEIFFLYLKIFCSFLKILNEQEFNSVFLFILYLIF